MTQSLIIVENDRIQHFIQSHKADTIRCLSANHLFRSFQNETSVQKHRKTKVEPVSETISDWESIKKLCNSAENVFFAFPFDMPSEWNIHVLKTLLDLPNKNVLRIHLNDLDFKSLRRAMKEPSRLNKKQVEAFECKKRLDQTLDRLIRNTSTSILNDEEINFGTILALKHAANGERMIDGRTPGKSLTVKATFRLYRNDFGMMLSSLNNKQTHIPNKHAAKAFLIDLKLKSFRIQSLKRQTLEQPAPSPLDTVSLLRKAEELYQYPVNQTLKIAQELYEGVAIGKSIHGLISYYLAESTAVSVLKSEEAREYVFTHFGNDYLAQQNSKADSSGKTVLGVDAIAPVSVKRHPKKIARHLTESQYNIYLLIWSTFVASYMRDAVSEQIQLVVSDKPDGRYAFSTTLSYPVFRGFRQCSPLFETGHHGAELDMHVGQEVQLVDLQILESDTSTQVDNKSSQLVQEMMHDYDVHIWEVESALRNIQSQGWANQQENQLVLTQKGRDAIQILESQFPKIFELSFVKQCSNNIAAVANGKMTWQKALDEIGAVLAKGPKTPEQSATKRLQKACPQCGADMVERSGKYGRFIACSRFPACKETQPYPIGVACPERGCHGQVIERHTANDKLFYGCSQYPECSFSSWQQPVNSACPGCGNLYLVQLSLEKHQYQCPQCRKKYTGTIG